MPLFISIFFAHSFIIAGNTTAEYSVTQSCTAVNGRAAQAKNDNTPPHIVGKTNKATLQQ